MQPEVVREMIGWRASKRPVAAATRGRIVQRVLVEGWSVAQTGAAFDVSERQVVRWVAAYRRRGMASLRRTADDEPLARRWLVRLRLVLTSFGAAEKAASARCIDLPRRDDDRPASRKRL